MRLEKVQQYVTRLLSEKLPPYCYYHSVNHTMDVVEAASTLISRQEEIQPGSVRVEFRELIVTAAWLHDTGFTRKYDRNEGEGAAIAGEVLSALLYSASEIEEIQRLILATQHDYIATSIGEKIIQDADLFYLATDTYSGKSKLLRDEWEACGKYFSDADWRQLQLEFLTAFEFKSEAGRALGFDGVRKNINRLQEEH